ADGDRGAPPPRSRLRPGRRPAPEARSPEGPGTGAVPELRAAPERGGPSAEGGGGPRGAGASRDARGARVAQRGALPPGAQAHAARGSAGPALVRAPDLRARLLHGLRREDAARDPRGPRAAALLGGAGPGREGGGDARRVLHGAGEDGHEPVAPT